MEVQELQGLGPIQSPLAFHALHPTIFTGSSRSPSSSISCVHLETGATLATLPTPSPATGLVTTPSHHFLVATTLASIRVYDLDTLSLLHVFPFPTPSEPAPRPPLLAASPLRPIVFAVSPGAPSGLHVVDIGAGSLDVFDAGKKPITALAVHASKPLVATGDRKGLVRLIEYKSRTTRYVADEFATDPAKKKLRSPVTALAFHPYKDILLVASETGRLAAWDVGGVSEAKLIAVTPGLGSLVAVQFHPMSSLFVTLSRDGLLAGFKLGTGSQVSAIKPIGLMHPSRLAPGCFDVLYHRRFNYMVSLPHGNVYTLVDPLAPHLTLPVVSALPALPGLDSSSSPLDPAPAPKHIIYSDRWRLMAFDLNASSNTQTRKVSLGDNAKVVRVWASPQRRKTLLVLATFPDARLVPPEPLPSFGDDPWELHMDHVSSSRSFAVLAFHDADALDVRPREGRDAVFVGKTQDTFLVLANDGRSAWLTATDDETQLASYSFAAGAVWHRVFPTSLRACSVIMYYNAVKCRFVASANIVDGSPAQDLAPLDFHLDSSTSLQLEPHSLVLDVAWSSPTTARPLGAIVTPRTIVLITPEFQVLTRVSAPDHAPSFPYFVSGLWYGSSFVYSTPLSLAYLTPGGTTRQLCSLDLVDVVLAAVLPDRVVYAHRIKKRVTLSYHAVGLLEPLGATAPGLVPRLMSVYDGRRVSRMFLEQLADSDSRSVFRLVEGRLAASGSAVFADTADWIVELALKCQDYSAVHRLLSSGLAVCLTDLGCERAIKALVKAGQLATAALVTDNALYNPDRSTTGSASLGWSALTIGVTSRSLSALERLKHWADLHGLSALHRAIDAVVASGFLGVGSGIPQNAMPVSNEPAGSGSPAGAFSAVTQVRLTLSGSEPVDVAPSPRHTLSGPTGSFGGGSAFSDLLQRHSAASAGSSQSPAAGPAGDAVQLGASAAGPETTELELLELDSLEVWLASHAEPERTNQLSTVSVSSLLEFDRDSAATSSMRHSSAAMSVASFGVMSQTLEFGGTYAASRLGDRDGSAAAAAAAAPIRDEHGRLIDADGFVIRENPDPPPPPAALPAGFSSDDDDDARSAKPRKISVRIRSREEIASSTADTKPIPKVTLAPLGPPKRALSAPIRDVPSGSRSNSDSDSDEGAIVSSARQRRLLRAQRKKSASASASASAGPLPPVSRPPMSVSVPTVSIVQAPDADAPPVPPAPTTLLPTSGRAPRRSGSRPSRSSSRHSAGTSSASPGPTRSPSPTPSYASSSMSMLSSITSMGEESPARTLRAAMRALERGSLTKTGKLAVAALRMLAAAPPPTPSSTAKHAKVCVGYLVASRILKAIKHAPSDRVAAVLAAHLTTLPLHRKHRAVAADLAAQKATVVGDTVAELASLPVDQLNPLGAVVVPLCSCAWCGVMSVAEPGSTCSLCDHGSFVHPQA